ncbi:chromosome segregation protein, partial [mine drainage metagenome]
MKITENLGIESPSSASLEQKRKILDSELERINSDKSAALNNIRNGNDEINEINQNIILLSDKNLCPLCKQPMTGEHMSELRSDYMKRIEELKGSSSGSENFIRAADVKISKIKRSLNFINSDVGGKLVSLEKNESDIENELNSLSRQEDKVKSEYESFTSADKKLQETEADLKSLEPQWRNFMGLRTLLDSIDIKNLEERITSDNLKINVLEEKNSRISAEIGYFPIKSDLEESEKISKEIESIRIKVEGVEEKRKNLLNYREELETMKMNITVKKGDIKTIEENISTFGFLEESINKEKSNFDSIRDSITRIDTKIKSQNDEMNIIDERIKNSGVEITRLQKMKKALKEIEVIIPAFRRDGIPRLIRVRSSQFITDMTTEIMSHFNLSVEGVKVTEDLDIEVFQNGSVKELQQLSGGERTAVAIALRMAMARYLISNISVLLMDEPTNFLDEDR